MDKHADIRINDKKGLSPENLMKNLGIDKYDFG